MKIRRSLALFLALGITVSLAACSPSAPSDASGSKSNPPSDSASVSEPEKPALTPAYSVEGFETVDADGNRITTGRDATGTRAMAVASKYEVSQVGAEIMEKGGNAVDAAVAMGFALGVCEPFTSGLGGGGIATIHTAEGKDIFIDFREIAPAGATLDLYVDAEGKNNGNTKSGGLASGVPGEVAGMLYMLEKYGTMSRQQIMQPAIDLANNGYVVSPTMYGAIADEYERMIGEYSELGQYYLKDGLPYEVGDTVTNPDLAKTLQLIAENGADAFYKGEVAEAIVAAVQKHGGVMTTEDLANYKAEERVPVTGTYRGYQIISAPPASSGGTHIVEALNVLENYDIGAMEVNSAEYLHLFSETFKACFADRAAYMADTAFADVPLDGLTSKDYAKTIYEKITDGSQDWTAGNPAQYEGNSTTSFSIADKEGNVVTVTQTIECFWGSKIAVEGYGFIMNDEMHDFSTSLDSVNKLEPGKRPLSSMSPTIVLREDGSSFMSVGSPGGLRIWPTVTQVISHVIDHNMDIQEAIDTARIFDNGTDTGINYESGGVTPVTADVAAALEAQGHAVTDKGEWQLFFGGVQGIVYQEDGTLRGGADPRRDGKALGF